MKKLEVAFGIVALALAVTAEARGIDALFIPAGIAFFIAAIIFFCRKA
jgi:hypothetical protein